jgi:hypothetical protein
MPSKSSIEAQFLRVPAKQGEGLEIPDTELDRAIAAQRKAAPANDSEPSEAPLPHSPDTKATRRPKWGRATVELPEYLIEAIKLEAVKGKSSVRHIVMTALRKEGYKINDADMIEDGRKTNGRKYSKE